MNALPVEGPNITIDLNESHSAWMPSFCQQNKVEANEFFRKRVRGVLNKLTPERFNTLYEEINSFNIGTAERLDGVISLVFEKAIDEPQFSIAYATLCGKLYELSKVTLTLTFKKTLITKCQSEFEKLVNAETIADRLAPLLAKVNEADDPDAKLEHRANYEEEERKLRRRSVGTVRFIGEIYKIGMLTSNIMIICIKELTDKGSEDKLECCCQLLTTIGAKLEESVAALKPELTESFRQMQLIVDRKIPNLKVSNRVRFMLQDVLDLRKRRWVPRQKEVKPMKMGQIQKEADAERQNITLLNYNVRLRHDNRGRYDNRSNGGYQKSNRQYAWVPSLKSARSDGSSSDNSMECYQYSDRNNSRSGSQHSRPCQRLNITTFPYPTEPTPNEITNMRKLVRELLGTHHIGEASVANFHVDIVKAKVDYRWALVRELLNTAVETRGLKTADRVFAGNSLNQWLNMKLITHCDILNGVKSFLELLKYISPDIPHIWLYIAESIAPLIENGNVKLIQLKTMCPDHAHQILEDLLPYMETTYGQNHLKSLTNSNELKNLLPKPELISTKLTNYIAALSNSTTTPARERTPEEHFKMDDVQRHIKKLLMENEKLDGIYSYISANVTEIDNNFMRALTSAVVDSSLDNRCKLNEKKFAQRIPLLERYVDGNGQLQVQCLIAIQILINRLDHPQGLMQSIFSSLVTEKIISADSIMNWKNRSDVIAGKGFAVASLRSFFDALQVSSEKEDN